MNSGDRDIIISGITITDKRKQMVDFSAPYFPAEQAIVVPQDSTVDSIAALKALKVGVVNSSTGDIVVSDVLGKNSTAIKRFDNTPLMLQELYEDGIGAAVGDVGVAKFYIKTHPEKAFKLVPDAKFERQYFGIAVAKGNDELRNKINAGLKKIVADGTYAKIYQTGSTATYRRCRRNNALSPAPAGRRRTTVSAYQEGIPFELPLGDHPNTRRCLWKVPDDHQMHHYLRTARHHRD